MFPKLFWIYGIDWGAHYCVKFLWGNNCFHLFKKKKHVFFFRFFMFFSYFMFSYCSTFLKYLMNMCLLSEETILKGGSPWAILILNNMFVVVFLYCVQLLPEVTNFQTFLLPFPLLTFVFLLSGILRNVQFPKIHDALLKPNKKNTAAKHFFKGVVHEQPWCSIVCLLWGSTIVSSCLRWEKIIHSFYPFLC